MQEETYMAEGQMAGNTTGTIITLIVGIGVSVLVLILVGSMSGQVYQTVEADIDQIGLVYFTNATGTFVNTTASNYTIQNSIKNGIISGFDAMEQTGSYLPIIVLAIVISLVLVLVLSFGGIGSAGGRGSAL